MWFGTEVGRPMHRLSEYTAESTGLGNYLTSENYSVNQALNGERL